MKKLSERQQLQVANERNMEVFKHNDMIQKARFSLSVQEQRTVLYAISKIQPEDTYLKEYVFDIKDFYNVIGWKNESYTEFKNMIGKLSDKGWTITLPDGTDSRVRWFTTARSNKRTGKVTLEFHKDMMPYLIELAKQNVFYTSFNLKYVLPMSCQYAPRLYEILKSYGNNEEWFFEIDDLKRLLDCQNYVRFPDFRRYVLEPAINEINKYTDLCVRYEDQREGRKVTRIYFYLSEKTKSEVWAAEREVVRALDGQRSDEEIRKDLANSEKAKFHAEREKAKEEDRVLQERLNRLAKK